LRREQRKLSRKQEKNIAAKIYHQKGENKGKIKQIIYKKPLRECKNWVKQTKMLNGINKKLKNIRMDHLHQSSSEIVKTKPSRIVMENLNVKGMMKNRHLAKAISNQNLYEFKRQIAYKCENFGIEFVEADRFFPSSKLCHSCGHKKVDMRLSERTYECPECGWTANRDFNAALNLASYKYFTPAA
jgi:putative transposase